MNTDNLIPAIEKFFFEIIGQLLPGMLMIAGIYILPPHIIPNEYVPASNLDIWILVGVAYVVGGGLTAIGSYFFVPMYLALIKNSCLIKMMLPQKALRTLKSNSEIDEAIEQHQGVKYLKSKYPSISSLSTLRNIAMSSISKDDKETVVRFMFLSLLSQGVATVIFLLTILKTTQILVNESIDSTLLIICVAIILASFFACLPFILREREFYDRARRLPIHCYIATAENDKPITYSEARPKKTVYLSGGHHSKWQLQVINNVCDFDYKDPSSTGLTDPEKYTSWDLEAIRDSDIVFAYLEANNPSGYGLSLEVGYAAALGKFIIFINEKPSSDPISAYFGMVRQTAQVNFDNLEDGINYLKKLY